MIAGTATSTCRLAIGVARSKEMPLEQIDRIADQAVGLGSLWCLLTGGEPLLREDFGAIYLL